MGTRALFAASVLVGLSMFADLAKPAAATGQFAGLNAGTVTATVDGAPFSATVSIATWTDGKLVLSNLSNFVQLQVPNAKVGTFAIKLDTDGGLIDVVLALRMGKRHITPVSGSVTIDAITASAASGRFAFEGKDVATESPVKVTNGRFQVKMTGGF